jgi:TRAP-type C4-dicarboxylate transport system permease small subunit
MRTIGSILDLVSRWMLYVSLVCIALMIVHITMDVIFRYFFGGSLAGTLEITSHYYMTAAVFLPLAFAQQERAHVMVELFTGSLAPRTIAAFDLLAGTLSLLFVFALFYFGLTAAIGFTAVGEYSHAASLPIVVWPSRWIVVLGTGALGLCIFVQIVSDAVFVLTGRVLVETRKGHGMETDI